MTRKDLPDMLYYVIEKPGGASSIVAVRKYVWTHCQKELHEAVTCLIHGSMIYAGQPRSYERQAA